MAGSQMKSAREVLEEAIRREWSQTLRWREIAAQEYENGDYVACEGADETAKWHEGMWKLYAAALDALDHLDKIR